MTDFEKRTKDEAAMIEEWPDPKNNYEVDEDEDDWDDYVDVPESQDFEVKFKLRGATEEEVSCIARYLFEAITNELEIPYDKLDDLEIEED